MTAEKPGGFRKDCPQERTVYTKVCQKLSTSKQAAYECDDIKKKYCLQKHMVSKKLPKEMTP